MPYQSIIAKKRDNFPLSADDINTLVDGITDNTLSDAQLAAFGMSVFLNGMSIEETADLTLAMRNSGQFLGWDLPGPVIDKHSTGGVGDMVSLILGLILAACGVYVPMISGRGLGHTGGTVDKLESIPGYNVMPSTQVFQQCVEKVGVSIIGQTAALAPADQRFYGVRDHAACVESIPLITASILAKKLAEGIDALVMDVKVGNGAFMPTHRRAVELADSISQVAAKLGLKVTALLTDMDSPLANTAGNALEIYEVIRFLRCEEHNAGLYEVTMRTAAESLLLAGKANDLRSAMALAERALASGAAAEAFAKMVAFLGGPSDLLEKPQQHLPQAKVARPLLAEEEGFISGYQTVNLGLLACTLGAGRKTREGKIDHSVGFSNILPRTTRVEKGQPLVTIHAKSESAWQEAADQYKHSCVQLAEQPVAMSKRIIECRYAGELKQNAV